MTLDLRNDLLTLSFIDAAPPPLDDVAWMMSHPATDIGQMCAGAWFVGPSEGATLREAATLALSRAARDIAYDVEHYPQHIPAVAREHAQRVHIIASLLALTEPTP